METEKWPKVADSPLIQMILLLARIFKVKRIEYWKTDRHMSLRLALHVGNSDEGVAVSRVAVSC